MRKIVHTPDTFATQHAAGRGRVEAGTPEAMFLNRELGVLAFNERVLAQAESERLPLLERLRFLCIASSNLDEFFEIRMAGLKEQLRQNPAKKYERPPFPNYHSQR